MQGRCETPPPAVSGMPPPKPGTCGINIAAALLAFREVISGDVWLDHLALRYTGRLAWDPAVKAGHRQWLTNVTLDGGGRLAGFEATAGKMYVAGAPLAEFVSSGLRSQARLRVGGAHTIGLHGAHTQQHV